MKRLVMVVVAIAVLAVIPAALAAGSLSGKYKTTIKGDHAAGGQLNGTWVLDFTRKAYTVSDNGKLVIRGRDSIKHGQITLHDKSGSDACPGAGTYKFTLSRNKVKFTLINDPNPACAGRRNVLAHAFTNVS